MQLHLPSWDQIREIGLWSVLAAVAGRWLLKRTPSADHTADTSLKDRELSHAATEKSIQRLEVQIEHLGLAVRDARTDHRECEKSLREIENKLIANSRDLEWLKGGSQGAFIRGIAEAHQALKEPPADD